MHSSNPNQVMEFDSFCVKDEKRLLTSVWFLQFSIINIACKGIKYIFNYEEIVFKIIMAKIHSIKLSMMNDSVSSKNIR